MGRKTQGPLLVEAIESNNLTLAVAILSKYFGDRQKLQQFIYSPVPRPLFEHPLEIPVLLASSLGDPSILNYLVTSCGADVNRTFTSGHPKKQKQTTCLITAVRKSAYGVVNYLLNVGCDPNRPDHKKRTPLHHAVRRADFVTSKLLIAKGSNHDLIDSAGNTALHVATLYGHTQLVKLLAKSGADLYKRGHFGALPLHMAAREGHVHLVSLFCAAFEVNPNLKVPCYDDVEKSPLHLAAMRGHSETVKVLVEDCGAVVDGKDPIGNTALHYCFLSFYDPMFESRSKDDHAETARILLEMGADPNARNAEGEMPLHMATKNGYEKGMEILLMMGAICGDEARNSAGSRPVDLLSDKTGVSASILKSAARDPRGFASETMEVMMMMSRRGTNSANASFIGSNGHLTKFSGKISENGSPRFPIVSGSSPRMADNRSLAGSSSFNASGMLGNSNPASMESINRANQFSKQASQIERSLRRNMYDEDGYLAPQEIPYVDEDVLERLYRERSSNRSRVSPTRSERRPPADPKRGAGRLRAPYVEDDDGAMVSPRSARRDRKEGTPLPKRATSENSSGTWEVTPIASVASTAFGRQDSRKSGKFIRGACNLSNVFEERSDSGLSGDTRTRHRKGRTVDGLTSKGGSPEDQDDPISDLDDSFSTVSEGEEETLKRNRKGRAVRSPTIKEKPLGHRASRSSHKRLRSSGSVSSSFESEFSSSISTGGDRRRTPPPIPGDDQSPFELDGIPSCKKLINVEVDSRQLSGWTIIRFSQVFPSRPPSTFVVTTALAKRVIKFLDDDKFLNKLSKNNCNLPVCSTQNLLISADDFQWHEYENTVPGSDSMKFIVKLCLSDNRLEWSKEVLKPPTMPKKGASERDGHRMANGDAAGSTKLASPKRSRIPNSETDSFTSATSSSSNEIHSFVPKEARKRAEHQRQMAAYGPNQSSSIKKGFGLQKGATNVRKSSWSIVTKEMDKSPKSRRHPLRTSPAKVNSASAEDILTTEDGSTYLNHDEARKAEMKHAKSQQNVLNWFSTDPKPSDFSDDDSAEPCKRTADIPYGRFNFGREMARPSDPSVYEQLEEQQGSKFGRNENGSRRYGKNETRIVLFEKSDILGFSVMGGNAYGIIIKSVEVESDAQKAGLRAGDELLEVNNKSIEGRCKEETYRIIERCSGRIELKIKRNHEKRITYENGDKFFVQACFDFCPDMRVESEISPVKQGEIFCVIDSMPENKEGYWKAYRSESKNKEEIFVPNRSKAIGIMAKALVGSSTIDKKQKGQSLFKSFRRNKSIDLDAKCDEINREFLKPYKHVILIPPHVKRPVFIAGLFSESICRRLIADSPGLFEIPDRIVEVSRFVPDIPSQFNGSLQRSISNSSLSPIDVEPIREIARRGKHPLCCLSPNAIEFVRRQSDLNPIAIFLSCPSKQLVREVANGLNVTSVDVKKSNVVSTMYENSLRFEKYYGNVFDAILTFRSDLSWFSILKDTIAKMQVIPKWRTVEILDDEADNTRERNGATSVSDNRRSMTTDDLTECSQRGGLECSTSRSKSLRKNCSKLSLLKSAQSMSSVVLDS